MLTVHNLHKSYQVGKTTYEVLKGVSLEVGKGECVAVMGPSGSGKTTLLNCISCYIPADSGSIRLGSQELARLDEDTLAAVRNKKLGFVFQDYKLLNNKTVWENVAFALEVIGTRRSTIKSLVPKVLNTVGLTGKEKNYPHELSGGEQQRITIARAMLKNAPILILDEATAFADPDNEAKVQAAFAELAKGKTVVMIAHRLSTVVNADCIYVVQDGRIAEAGTKGDLCARNGLFAKMWQDYQSSVRWKVEKEGPAC